MDEFTFVSNNLLVNVGEIAAIRGSKHDLLDKDYCLLFLKNGEQIRVDVSFADVMKNLKVKQ